MILLLSFAFLAGLATILAPCIWPLIPIILSSSINSKGARRPLGITLGLMLSFAFLTLFISYLVKSFHFNAGGLRLIAVAVIGVLGVAMVIPRLSSLIEGFLSGISSYFGIKTKPGSGFAAGFLTGLSLGIVWSPCSGPILAAVAALAATGKVTLAVFVITLAYVLGVGIPLFIIAYGGNRLVTGTRALSKHLGAIQRGFGILMVLTAIAIYANYDTLLESKLLDAFPGLSSHLTGLESNPGVTRQLEILKGKKSASATQPGGDTAYFNADFAAPDFTGATQWLNTERPAQIADLRGSIVLVDFWTYTCVNCIRTLPHLASWYEKYHAAGFEIIGVHTPEFQFEHAPKNVLDAIRRFHLPYPVLLDNDFVIWNNYNNQYWPAEYLVDAKGIVRREHFGEGEYDQTELAIRELLKENGRRTDGALDAQPDQSPGGRLSPETYLGTDRMEYYFPTGKVAGGKRAFTPSGKLRPNSFTFGGEWDARGECAVAGRKAALYYWFTARKVFLVLRPGAAGKDGRIKIFLDSRPADSSNAGADVNQGEIIVNSDRLYNVIDLRGKTESHMLLIRFETPGIEAFAFTFG